MVVQAETAPIGTEAAPSFGEAFWLWLKIGCINFGGPAGQIAMMHRMLVDEKKWIDEPRFLHALNFCMLLPGPEAQKLATYIGWALHGVRGGLVAGILFVLPGFVAILALTLLYVGLRDVRAVEALLFGLKAGVLTFPANAGFPPGAPGRVRRTGRPRVPSRRRHRRSRPTTASSAARSVQRRRPGSGSATAS